MKENIVKVNESKNADKKTGKKTNNMWLIDKIIEI